MGDNTSKKTGLKYGYKFPDDMPANQAKSVKLGRQCGAARSTGGYCKQSPVPGQTGGLPHRCKHHGGASTGAPEGNDNAFKHGVYSALIKPGEEELFEGMKAGDLEHDIKITKLRLYRALMAKAKQEDDLSVLGVSEQQDALVLDQVFQESGKGGKKVSVTKKRVDFDRNINMIINQLCKLENQRTQTMAVSNDLSPKEKAQMAIDVVKEFRAAAQPTGEKNAKSKRKSNPKK